MNGQTILAKVIETYSSFETYSDIGTVESPDSSGISLEFQSDFRRPFCFRFHWLSLPSQLGKKMTAQETTIWSDGEHFTSRFQGELAETESFSLLVAGATGISKGSVHVILNLLIPNAIGLYHPWPEMTDVKRLDDQDNCYQIIGTSRGVDDTRVWIEKETYVVRRLKESNVVTEQKCEEMRAYSQQPEQVEMMVNALKKQGISEDMIAATINGLDTMFKPTTYVSDYRYNSVTVNHSLAKSVFVPSA
ncbi:hypothetical protein BH11CYA1_BH11CYA1_21060 [soil metagenome]